jgi:hypothetical protein
MFSACVWRPATAPDDEPVRLAVRAIVGEQARVEVEWATSLEPSPGHKFRLVECRVGRASG